MSLDMEADLTEFLHDNINIFTWRPSYMRSIPHEITEHCLNIKADTKLV